MLAGDVATGMRERDLGRRGRLSAWTRSGTGDTVAELREGLIGGTTSGGRLEKVLNEQAAEGWRLRAITAVDVEGRIGPGGRRRGARHLRAAPFLDPASARAGAGMGAAPPG
ncbi:DUF4177 domain-containing protein [Aquipuribacter nitratireducens]|uniref:DUF4177 domain-containing protein n=1 Tax=Aquipuribacter nitratireducens TaxID=650104 RepID=A0ABW0GRM5_9MICO